jgi:hypothetical protein
MPGAMPPLACVFSHLIKVCHKLLINTETAVVKLKAIRIEFGATQVCNCVSSVCPLTWAYYRGVK